MSRVSYEEADRVAQQVSDELGSPGWLCGVGVELDVGEGYVVSVRMVGEQDVQLPERVHGVRILIRIRELPRAFRSPPG